MIKIYIKKNYLHLFFIYIIYNNVTFKISNKSHSISFKNHYPRIIKLKIFSMC